jgi:hypothetical protein
MGDINQDGTKKFQRSFSQIKVENIIDFANAFQIRTNHTGYNAGRKYVVRATSNEMLSLLTDGISSIRRAAVLSADTRGPWARMQDRARKIYSSAPFQGVATFLILAVRRLPLRPRRFRPRLTAPRIAAELRDDRPRGAAPARAALQPRRLADPREADARRRQHGLHRRLRRGAERQPLLPLVRRLLLQRLVRPPPPPPPPLLLPAAAARAP